MGMSIDAVAGRFTSHIRSYIYARTGTSINWDLPARAFIVNSPQSISCALRGTVSLILTR